MLKLKEAIRIVLIIAAFLAIRANAFAQDANAKRFAQAKALYDFKNYDSSFPVFKELADNGYADAFGYAALYYELGYGTDTDTDKACFYYEKSLKAKQPWWSYRYGNIAYGQGKFEKAWECYNVVITNAPNSYYAGPAAFYLAAMAHEGVAGNASTEQIVEWLRMGAKQGYDSETRRKSNNLLQEIGSTIYTMSDFDEKISTVGESGESLFDTGSCYFSGITTPKDLAKAYVYFKASASKNYPKAYEYLGYLYKDKSLPIYDPEKSDDAFNTYALMLLDKVETESASKDDYYALGDIYRRGLGTAPDTETAMKYYRTGAEMGDDACQLWLGQLLEAERQFAEALYWFEESGRKGQGWSAYLAGKIYEEGRSGEGVNLIPKNINLAIEMYKASASSNNSYAREAQSRLDALGVVNDKVFSKENTREKPAPMEKSPTFLAADVSTLGISISTEQVVDLGLKSGTKWGGWNIGATSPEMSGEYYSWGQTVAKKRYDSTTFFNEYSDGEVIIGTLQDVATKKWGSEFCMPTHAQAMELLFDCKWTWCSYKGVNGFAVTGPNKKSLFMPAAGCYFASHANGKEIYGKNETCYYWTGEADASFFDSRAYCLIMSEGYGKYDNRNGEFADGKTVRAVVRQEKPETKTTILQTSTPSLDLSMIPKGKRAALVIGNAAYPNEPLKNPENDANDVAQQLKEFGFEVELLRNGTRREMNNVVNKFCTTYTDYDAVLFYYSGHGMSSKGANYLIPVDAEMASEADVEYECTSVNHVLAKLEESGSKMMIIVLDACRNNPFTRSWYRGSGDKGLSIINAPRGTFISYATSPGNVALDGKGRNSPYTNAFLETLKIPGLHVLDFFQTVSEKVIYETNEQQVPWSTNSALSGKFYFNLNQ